MITSDDIEARATAGGLNFGHSHSSDPIGCIAGLASLEEIRTSGLAQRAVEIGANWRARMLALQQRYELIGDVRGRGLIQGIELVRDRHTKEPARDEANRLFGLCIQEGLLFSVRGQHGNVIRFVPPFSTTDAQIDQAADILERAIRQVS
jgi:4-aminobutyrate aminotransferase-like enzyme